MDLNNRQRGLSLLWCAILVGIVSVAAMGALFSMRHERNIFADAWKRIMRTPAVQTASDAVKPAPAEVRKCVVDGKVMYSNVECGAGNPGSRKVDLTDTRGIEAPKAPPALAPQADGASDLRNKMIENALSR